MCESFPRLELVRARPKIFPHAKNQPWGSSSFFNQFCTYKHLYIYIYTQGRASSGVASSRLLVVHRWCVSSSRWCAGLSHSTSPPYFQTILGQLYNYFCNHSCSSNNFADPLLSRYLYGTEA